MCLEWQGIYHDPVNITCPEWLRFLIGEKDKLEHGWMRDWRWHQALVKEQKCLGLGCEKLLCYRGAKWSWKASEHILGHSESPAETFWESLKVFQQWSEIMIMMMTVKKSLLEAIWNQGRDVNVSGRRGGKWEEGAGVHTLENPGKLESTAVTHGSKDVREVGLWLWWQEWETERWLIHYVSGKRKENQSRVQGFELKWLLDGFDRNVML